MAYRTVSWNALSRNLHDAKVVIPTGLLSARALCQGFARYQRRPLVVSGKFDRSAVMAAAVAAAKAHQDRHGGSWTDAMSVCLRASWQAAKIAHRATAH